MSSEIVFKFTYKSIDRRMKWRVTAVDPFYTLNPRQSGWHDTYDQAILEIKKANPLVFLKELGLA